MNSKRVKSELIFVAVLALLFSNEALFGATSTAAFFKIPIGARERAMGETGVSHASAAGAVWWNPALSAFGSREIRFGAFRWLADGRGSTGAVKLSIAKVGIAAYYLNLATPGFEARERPGPAAAEFTIHQAYIATGGAVEFKKNWAVGAMVKGYLEDIYGNRITGFPVFDLGTAWQKDGWMAGMALKNWGQNKQGFPLPLTVRAGLSRNMKINEFSLTTAMEFSAVRSDVGRGHIGLELGWQNAIFLRSGWIGNSQISRPTFGLGLAHSVYRIDASFAPFDEGLGSGWRFGVGFKL